MATNPLYNNLGDAWNGDAVAYPTAVTSTGYSGTWNPVVAPASANYPFDSTPGKSRYVIRLPFIPAQGKTLALKYGSTVMTPVSGAPSLSGQYRVAPSSSLTPNLVEINSAQAGATIDYNGYASGAIINSNDSNLLTIPALSLTNDLTVGGNASIPTVTSAIAASGKVSSALNIDGVGYVTHGWNYANSGSFNLYNLLIQAFTVGTAAKVLLTGCGSNGVQKIIFAYMSYDGSSTITIYGFGLTSLTPDTWVITSGVTAGLLFTMAW